MIVVLDLSFIFPYYDSVLIYYALNGGHDKEVEFLLGGAKGVTYISV